MKIRFQLKGLLVEVRGLPQGLSITVRAHSAPPAEAAGVSPLLRQRINACKTMTELLQLLFSTTEKTEAVMALFDQKLEALERGEGFSFYQPFKPNNNESTSSHSVA